MKNKIVLLIFAVALISCNQKKEKQKQAEEKVAFEVFRKHEDSLKNTDHFQVDIEVLVSEADNFQLFYSDDYLLSFSPDKMITTRVDDKPEFQTIRFDLDVGVFPERFRFDLGSNQNQRRIQINSIAIRYENKEVVVPKDLFNQYFIPNEFINGHNGDYELFVIEKEGKKTYDPFLLCSPELIRLIMRL